MDVHRIFGDTKSEFIGLAVFEAAFDTAAGHPNRKTARMMIPPVVVFGEFTLAVNGTAKFISSATVGVVWTSVSPTAGFSLAAVLMTLEILALLRIKGE